MGGSVNYGKDWLYMYMSFTGNFENLRNCKQRYKITVPLGTTLSE